MPRWTSEQLSAHQARRAGNRPRSELQEHQDDRAWAPDNGPKEAGLDGPVYPTFRVTVEVHISDERDRDNDGAYSTLQDCLIAAIGRLAQVDPTALRKFASGAKRTGRRRARNPRA